MNQKQDTFSVAMPQKLSSSLLKIPKSGYIGGILGLGVIVAINFLWVSFDPGFENVHPHPFWLVILPMAARYGAQTGAITGLMAGVTMLCLQKLGHPAETWGELMTLSNLVRPLLFFAMGLLFGEIRETHKLRFQKLAEDHKKLLAVHEDLVQQYEALNRAKQELDTHIISQEQSLSTVYEAAQGLKSLKEQEIYPAVLEILVRFLSAQSCSVYLIKENQLVLTAAQDTEEAFNRSQELPLNTTSMITEAINARQTISLNALTPSANFKELTDDGVIICVPLLDANFQVFGVINIERLPFLKFNPQAVRLSSIIGEWCSSAIENARTYQESRDKNIADDLTGAYTYTYFIQRMHEEFKRARRYGQEMSLVVFNIDDFDAVEPESQKDILTVISLVFQNRLRDIDLYFHDEKEFRYFLVLPNTPLNGAKIASNKIFEEIQAFKFRPYGDERVMSMHIGLAAFTGNMQDPEELIEKAVDAIEKI